MLLKRISIVLIISLLVSILGVSVVLAEEEIIDPNIPESWYEAPQLSSELGISEFNQAPMLDEAVSQGDLPSVTERLPEDPPVLEPYGEIGKYGGTAVVWDRQFSYYETNFWTGGGRYRPIRFTPDSSALPQVIKGWEYSDDYKEFTIFLRKGVKWSDGEPFTADDIMYSWEYDATNEDLNPVPPEEWNPSLLDVTKNDKWSVTLHFGREVPKLHEVLHWNIGWIGPEHFMRQFHPDIVGEEKVLEMAAEVGLENWYDFYDRIKSDSLHHPEYDNQVPSMTPYVAVERTETYMIYERNPYFFVVDTEGNQLPYIDKLRVNLANSSEMAATKAATGEATFAGRHLLTRDIPLYKRNEEKEDYTTYIYYRVYGGEANIQPNLTVKNDKLRAIFHDFRFRRALSHAINREEINNKIYYGHGMPSQMTVNPVNEEFREEYAEAYAEYDPDKSRELLDEMGMVDRNGDGFREMPEGILETMTGEEVTLEGEEFNPTLIFTKMGAVEPSPLLELVRGYFEEIGINIDIKNISRELYNERGMANDREMGVWTGAASGKFGDTNWSVRNYAPITGSYEEPWPAWESWYQTKGETGMEPPAKIKELIEYAETAVYSTDEEEREFAKQKLLEGQAENLWTVGTVSSGPQPLIVSNKLKNVPEKGIWDFSTGYLPPYRPEQFYLED